MALPAELKLERAVLETEIAQAEVDYETEKIHMEKIRKEFEIYHEILPYHVTETLSIRLKS